MSIIGPYQYKNKGQNFLLAGQVASLGSSMGWQWHAGGRAALKTLMGFNISWSLEAAPFENL